MYVGNLSWSITNEELADFFNQFGKVTSASVIMDRDTNRSRGFGFVEFDGPIADKVVKEANDQDLGGRKLVVKVAQPKEQKDRKSYDNRF